MFRFGLGPRPDEALPRPAEARDALLGQLARPPQTAWPDMPSSADTLRRHIEVMTEMSAGRQQAGDVARVGRNVMVLELQHRVRLAVATETPLIERLVLHWANHFTTAAANRAGPFIGPMEREAIRPNMLGRFEALLVACTTHPAMLIYLDNRSSIGPNSAIGQRRRRGLNENLAREVLELHTLGVDGGYTQQDVVELAKVLTGWTVRIDLSDVPLDRRIGFEPTMHEPGPKTILGRRYAEDGPGQLRAVLRDLARHPSTARHVTRRMVRHFVGEGAPPALATELAALFRRTEGDLGAVTRALVSHEAAWTTPAAKMRPPVELVMGAARVLGNPAPRPPAQRALAAMGQTWNLTPSPAGWPEEDDAWASPEAVKTRLDWAIEVAGTTARVDARALAEAAFGDALSTETRRALARAASGGQALTLMLMCPEFQRR